MSARCRQEIAAVEVQLRAGHPDVEGLCLALMDWSTELRLLQRSQGLANMASPAARKTDFCVWGRADRPNRS